MPRPFARLICILSALLLFLSAAEAQSVLRRGNGTEPDTLDPHRASGTWENNIIGDMFIGLTTENPAGEVIPGAAESWTVSNDGLVYTFTLREGLVWSDGAPLTASDFVFAFRRILNPATAARYASLLYPVLNARAVNLSERPPEDVGVRAADEGTVEITLENPAPFLLQLLTHYTTYPVPAHVVREYGDDWVKPGTMVSNGAYVLEEWVSNGHVRVVKNPNFFDAENVAIDEVYYYPIEDSRTALQMFRAGEIDMNITTSGFPAQMMKDLLAEMPGEARVYPYLGNSYLPINMRRAPMEDIRVRRAVSMAIDREIIAERVLAAGQRPAYAFVPPETANHQSGAELDFAGLSMDERRAEARRLLAEAGYGPDNPLRFPLVFRSSYDNQRRMSAVAAMLRQVGIEAAIEGYEARVAYNRMQEGDFVVGDAGWVADYNDPYNFLYLMLCDAGPMNYPGYCNPDFDALVDEASKTLDLEARAALMSRAEQILLDDHAVIPMDYTPHRVLVSGRVQGYEDNISNTHRTRFMRLAGGR